MGGAHPALRVSCEVGTFYGGAHIVDKPPCEASRVLEAEFPLPAAGDLVVDLDAP